LNALEKQREILSLLLKRSESNLSATAAIDLVKLSISIKDDIYIKYLIYLQENCSSSLRNLATPAKRYYSFLRLLHLDKVNNKIFVKENINLSIIGDSHALSFALISGNF
jgi:hypothetical protein